MGELDTTPERLIAPVVDRLQLIAVVTLEDWRSGPPLARALAKAGVGAEITLRTSAGLEAVRAACSEVPEAVVGVGTCLTQADLAAAKEAGAAFAVSPGAPPALLRDALALDLPYLPGVATATELMDGFALGYRTFKFFPALPAGGLAYLKALHGPFPQIRFCPTGGIDLEGATQFLKLPNVVCVGGSWMTPDTLLRAKDWAGVERLAARSVDALRARPPRA